MKIETVMTDEGPMDIHVAVPEAPGPHPAVVVMQEAFGVNRHIVEICARFAREGFVAAAPDLFHRAGRGLTFGYDEFPKLRPFFSALTNDGIALDARAAIALLRARPDVRADRVGVTARRRRPRTRGRARSLSSGSTSHRPRRARMTRCVRRMRSVRLQRAIIE